MNNRTASCFVIAGLSLVVVACSAAPKRGPAPEVTLVQMSKVRDLRLDVSGGLPMEFRLDIVNPADHAITLLTIEVESVGESGAYGMKRVRHAFNKQIAAKSADAVDFRAWIYPIQVGSKGEINSPVMLRGSAQFEGPDGVFRRNFVARGQ